MNDPLFITPAAPLVPRSHIGFNGPDDPTALLSDPLIMTAVSLTAAGSFTFSGVPVAIDFAPARQALIAQLVKVHPLTRDAAALEATIGELLRQHDLDPQEDKVLTQMVAWEWNVQVLARSWLASCCSACEPTIPVNYTGNLTESDLGMLIRAVEWQRQLNARAFQYFQLIEAVIKMLVRSVAQHLSSHFQVTLDAEAQMAATRMQVSPSGNYGWWLLTIEYMATHHQNILGRQPSN